MRWHAILVVGVVALVVALWFAVDARLKRPALPPSNQPVAEEGPSTSRALTTSAATSRPVFVWAEFMGIRVVEDESGLRSEVIDLPETPATEIEAAIDRFIEEMKRDSGGT